LEGGGGVSGLKKEIGKRAGNQGTKWERKRGRDDYRRKKEVDVGGSLVREGRRKRVMWKTNVGGTTRDYSSHK